MPNRLSTFFITRRFRPALLPTLAMLVLVALTVALGNWQRHRAAEKESLAAQYATAAREPARELSGAEVDATALRYRTVRVRGEYDAAHQLLIDNKVRTGRAGFDVVAPLKLAGGDRYVLIDRGWTAQAVRRADLPHVPPPMDTVTVFGRANLPPRRYIELKAEPPAGPVWQNLDIDRIAAATRLPLLPIIVEQLEPVTPADGLVRDWPPPDLGSSEHQSYMMQWYSLGALAVVLWLVLNWHPSESEHGSAW